MFFNVVTRNVTTGANEDVFCIIKGVQMGDVDVSDELSSNRNRREDDLHVLIVGEILAPAPPIDSGKHGYVWREKIFAKPSIRLQKRKGRKIIPC
jgi:hypothetical protein